MDETLLRINNLVVSIDNKKEKFDIINDISFELKKGEVLGIERKWE